MLIAAYKVIQNWFYDRRAEHIVDGVRRHVKNMRRTRGKMVYGKNGESVHRSTAQVLRPRKARHGEYQAEEIISWSWTHGGGFVCHKQKDALPTPIVTEAEIVEQRIKVHAYLVANVRAMLRTQDQTNSGLDMAMGF